MFRHDSYSRPGPPGVGQIVRPFCFGGSNGACRSLVGASTSALGTKI